MSNRANVDSMLVQRRRRLAGVAIILDGPFESTRYNILNNRCQSITDHSTNQNSVVVNKKMLFFILILCPFTATVNLQFTLLAQ